LPGSGGRKWPTGLALCNPASAAGLLSSTAAKLSLAVDHSHFDAGDTGADHAELLCRSLGDVDDPTANKRTAVVDAHDDRLAVPQIFDPHLVPKERLRCAAASAPAFILSPLAVLPEAADLVDGFNFGEVWARSDLSPKERMVCILAALMCRGHIWSS
jgi:hypothetical protein